MLKKLKKILIFLLCLPLIAFLLFLYMQWEYQNIKITHLDLTETDSPLSGIKIIYAADFQYDMDPANQNSIEEDVLKKSIDLILEQEADLILLGGDFFSFSHNATFAAEYFGQLHAPMGVYSICGNHDFYAKDTLISQLTNIRFLENETVELSYNETPLTILGVEDFWFGTPSIDIENTNPDGYHILLTHNPDYFETLSPEENAFIDLTLAGHTHGGQITFLGIAGAPPVLSRITQYGEKYRYGEKNFEGNRIYITSGLGGNVYHYPLRFGARPEIVVIE